MCWKKRVCAGKKRCAGKKCVLEKSVCWKKEGAGKKGCIGKKCVREKKRLCAHKKDVSDQNCSNTIRIQY